MVEPTPKLFTACEEILFWPSESSDIWWNQSKKKRVEYWISQIGSFPQIEVKIWKYWKTPPTLYKFERGKILCECMWWDGSERCPPKKKLKSCDQRIGNIFIEYSPKHPNTLWGVVKEPPVTQARVHQAFGQDLWSPQKNGPDFWFSTKKKWKATKTTCHTSPNLLEMKK